MPALLPAVYYAGLSVGQLLEFMTAMQHKIIEFYVVAFAFRAKLADINRIIGELDEAFKFEISYNIHVGSCLANRTTDQTTE